MWYDMDTMTTQAPTSEQAAILAAATDTSANLMVNALAGTGKTSTLEMIERAVSAKPILYLCFNKKIADEATERMLSTTTVRTFNALGHRIWSKACAKSQIKVNPKKSQDILREIIKEVKGKDQGPLWDSYWPVVHGVALAKALGHVPEGKFPNAKRLCTANEFHTKLEE